jgi:restriction system protein
MPTYDQLMPPTLAALHELGGSASIPELVERVIGDLKPPREVIEQPHPGSRSWTELEYRLAWARTYLKKYGLIDNSARGVWALTPAGLEAKTIDPQTVVRAVRLKFTQERDTEQQSEEGPGAEANDVPGAANDSALPTWRDSLLERLVATPSASFERLCMRVLRESGFIQVEVVGRSGDGGIDGYGVVRLHGLLSFRVSFQCKCWKKDNTVGASVIRDFRGAMMGRAEKGLVITTSSFTRDARSEAARDGATAIDLIDGELLIDKLKELGLGVRTRRVEAVDIDAEWFNAL